MAREGERRRVMLTPEMVEYYSMVLGWPPDTVVEVFTYWQHGGP